MPSEFLTRRDVAAAIGRHPQYAAGLIDGMGLTTQPVGLARCIRATDLPLILRRVKEFEGVNPKRSGGRPARVKSSTNAS